MSATFKLPPTQRDFEIYDAIQIAACSTYSQADKHQISQTRVRQIVRRVVEWVAEVLPPQTKVGREKEVHLARQIAADRFQRQYEQMTTYWDMTQDAKYAGIRMRITTAQARLGVVGGIIDGLAADAIEGLPVGIVQQDATTLATDAAPDADEAQPDSHPAGDAAASCDDPATADAAADNGASADPPSMDIKYATLLYRFQDILRNPADPPRLQGKIEEAKRVLLAAGVKLDDDTDQNTPAAAEIGHPSLGDCSLPGEEPAGSPPTAPSSAAENHGVPTVYNDDTADRNDLARATSSTSPPLLIRRDSLPVTELQMAPDQPGATISQNAPSTPGLCPQSPVPLSSVPS